MITITLDQESSDKNPRILTAVLPSQTFMNGDWHEAELRVALTLENEVPVIAFETKPSNLPLNIVLRPQHFKEWRRYVERLSKPTFAAFSIACLQQGTKYNQLAEEVIQWWSEPRTGSVHLHSKYNGARLLVSPSDLPLWHSDLGRILDLAVEISDLIDDMRQQRQGDILMHINNLIAASIL